MASDLFTLVDSLHAEHGHIGADLIAIPALPSRLRFRLALHAHDRTPPYAFPELEVIAHSVLDYDLRPAHNLFEGTASLELLDTHDELLTKRHFDSCDNDRWDSPLDPGDYRLLRCGRHYVIARRFTGEIHPDSAG